MRHAPLDVFTPSCLDMHGEYILTLYGNADPHINVFVIGNNGKLNKFRY
jgi:hypothetical protein